MKSLNNTYTVDVSAAHIITLPDNPTSVGYTERCVSTCKNVGQKYVLWNGFDGTSGEIVIPDQLKNANWLSWLKVTDQELSITEVACALSHISLWAKCVEDDQPLVVLEHDAVMVSSYKVHRGFGVIDYLGCNLDLKGERGKSPIPMHGSKGNNYHFIYCAHAYSIDPAVAKNLLAHVIKYGICESLDIMIRADIFPIIQSGFYAYNKSGETTITGRKTTIDGKQR